MRGQANQEPRSPRRYADPNLSPRAACTARPSSSDWNATARLPARQLLALPRWRLPHPVRTPRQRTIGARDRGQSPPFDLSPPMTLFGPLIALDAWFPRHRLNRNSHGESSRFRSTRPLPAFHRSPSAEAEQSRGPIAEDPPGLPPPLTGRPPSDRCPWTPTSRKAPHPHPTLNRKAPAP